MRISSLCGVRLLSVGCALALLVALGLLLNPQTVHAATTVLYIAPNGNDMSGSGSLTAPYATLAKASSVAVPGTTVYARGGVYPIVQEQQLTAVGTAWAPIIFTSYPGERAIFDGIGMPRSTRSPNGSDTAFNLAGQYLEFVGFEVRNAGIQSWGESIFRSSLIPFMVPGRARSLSARSLI